MPLYEFRCQECGHQLELLLKSNEDAPGPCPHCQAHSLQRQVAAPRFQLKGTGWYETDFKTKPQPPADAKQKTDTKDKKPDKKKQSE